MIIKNQKKLKMIFLKIFNIKITLIIKDDDSFDNVYNILRRIKYDFQ